MTHRTLPLLLCCLTAPALAQDAGEAPEPAPPTNPWAADEPAQPAPRTAPREAPASPPADAPTDSPAELPAEPVDSPPDPAQPPAEAPAPVPVPVVAPRGPSPVARCADAALGTEVEVCLQLALENPGQVDGIAAALRAHIAREGSGDQQLLLALLALVDDGSAPEAAAQLAVLGDNRAVPALTSCAERRPAYVSAACIRSLAPFEEGLPHLERWLSDSTQPLDLRIEAAKALGLVGSIAAADALVDALRRPRLPATVRRAILDTLRAVYPDRASETEGQVASDGRLWLSLGGAYGMGYAMGAAGYYGQTNLAALGWVTGVVGGGTAGWLYGRAWPMEAGDAAHIATGGVLGSSAGMLIGGGAANGHGDWIYGGGLLGLATGYTLTAATRTAHQGTGVDAVEASSVATMSALAASSAVNVVQTQTQAGFRERTWVTTTTTYGGVNVREPGASAPTIAAGIGLAGGAIAGYVAAPHMDLSGRDGGLILLSSSWGLAVGSLIPLNNERGLLPLFTWSTGALLGYGLSAPFEVPGDVQAAAWVGAGYGGVFGAGVGMILDPYSNLPSATALGFGTAGMVGGAALAQLDPEPLDDRDVVLVGFTTGWLAWQGVGWGAYTQAPDPTVAGWFLIVPSAVGAGVAAATPILDVPVPHTAAATSVGLWGAYAGGVAAELSNNDPLLWSLVGSDIGLVGGAVVMSPLVGAPPVVIGVADAGGVLGGSVAALGTAFITSDGDTILTTSLIGAGVGFAGGAALGATWKKGGTRDMARLRPGMIPGRWAVRPDMGPDRMGLAVEVREW